MCALRFDMRWLRLGQTSIGDFTSSARALDLIMFYPALIQHDLHQISLCQQLHYKNLSYDIMLAQIQII